MKTYQSHNYTKNVITITPDTLATGANRCHNLLPTATRIFLAQYHLSTFVSKGILSHSIICSSMMAD